MREKVVLLALVNENIFFNEMTTRDQAAEVWHVTGPISEGEGKKEGGIEGRARILPHLKVQLHIAYKFQASFRYPIVLNKCMYKY